MSCAEALAGTGIVDLAGLVHAIAQFRCRSLRTDGGLRAHSYGDPCPDCRRNACGVVRAALQSTITQDARRSWPAQTL